jgi:hypothetical protein
MGPLQALSLTAWLAIVRASIGLTDSILHRESFRAGLPAPMMIPVAIAIAIVVIAIAIAAVGTTIRFADPVLK